MYGAPVDLVGCKAHAEDPARVVIRNRSMSSMDLKFELRVFPTSAFVFLWSCGIVILSSGYV